MEVMLFAKGICWIDDCRIPHSEEIMIASSYKETKQSENGWGTKNRILEPSNRGRFPANILVSDDMLNDGVITKQSQRTYKPTDNTASLFGNSPQAHGIGIGDKVTNSRYYDIDKWFDKILESCE